jgi:hypothetical protein
VCNEFIGELLRGIRLHFTRFLDNLKDTGGCVDRERGGGMEGYMCVEVVVVGGLIFGGGGGWTTHVQQQQGCAVQQQDS